MINEAEVMMYIIKTIIPLIAIITPLLKLNTSITKLSSQIEEITRHNNTQDYRLDKHSERLDDYGIRIVKLEERDKSC